jgi:hypothetical protein
LATPPTQNIPKYVIQASSNLSPSNDRVRAAVVHTFCFVRGINKNALSVQGCHQDSADNIRAALQIMVEDIMNKDKKYRGLLY